MINTNNTTEILHTNSFMEEVKTYMAYKIASVIAVYFFPVLVPIGLIGNTLSFLVMIKPNNRKMSTCIYMAAISINDNIMMALAFNYWLGVGIKLYEADPLQCELMVYWVFVTMQNSTFQVCAMTVDKYIAIKWPHKTAIYSTAKRAKMTIVGILFCTLIFNIPHFFISKLIGSACVGYVAGGTFTVVYSWMSFIINGLVPFISLLYMNCVIIKIVRGSRKMLEVNEERVGQQMGQGQSDISKR